MYTDFKLFDSARHLFDEIHERNVVTWTTMINSYISAGNPLEALRMFNLMSEFELETPNPFTFSSALKACSVLGDLEMGKSIHNSIFRGSLQCDTILMNTLLDMYVKCRSLSDAREVFDAILSKNSISWNTMIGGYAKEGQMDEAVNLFLQMPVPDTVSWNTVIAGFMSLSDSSKALEFVQMMHRHGVHLDQFTFPCALKACGCLNMLTAGKETHCHVVKSGFGSCYISVSALVDVYGKCGEVGEAKALFDEYLLSSGGSPRHNLGLWNSMLSGYVLNNCNVNALELVSQIHKSGTRLDFYFSSSLKVCINLLNFRLGLQTHALIVTSGYGLDYVVGSILVDFYARHGYVEGAFGLFKRLPNKDIVAWTALISVCSQNGSSHLAFSLLRDMICLNLQVDHFVTSSVLKACSTLAGLGSGKQVHTYCIKCGYESEQITVTSIIDMYLKCGEIDDALTLFIGINERDTICWSGIIAGCGHNGRSKEALEYEMIKSGVKPNEVTYLGVLSACRHSGLTDQTLWSSLLWACGIHGNAESGSRIARHLVSLSPGDPSVYVTLANVYASLGMWNDAIKNLEPSRASILEHSIRPGI
ncbi:hypothetical protein C5167_013109 [Papaver somniferum]|uniref:Pentacotripeptide-repeat region of PRORP domain-containing protein n=1 Tax=Papaver somniferum TaxID=3469 RepID=A0A4Y7IZE8_PAPSO|nr:hypothetical protein C5167_013109 [Papaver somniferum]